MKMRRFKHAFLRLSPEEKVVGLGGLCIIVGMFLPWYTVEYIVDQRQVTETGLSGNMGVIGFVVLLFAILALLMMLGEHLRFQLPSFGYKKEQIILFLMGESAFLLLLTIAIYTKDSLDFPEASLRFGLYLALLGACLATFAAFSLLQKLQKRSVEDFFHQNEAEPVMEMAEEEEEVMQEPAAVPPQTPEPAEEMPEEVIIETQQTTVDDTGTVETVRSQAHYFAREAGIEAGNKTPEPATEEPEAETEDSTQADSAEEQKPLSMNFYED